MKKKIPLLEAIAVLVGTTIGAGILGLPYVFYQAGFLTGLLIMTAIFLTVLLLNLHLGEIVTSTKGYHQLSGYAEKYLGKTGKYIMFCSVVFGFYGALLAYIIGEGKVLAALTGGSPFVYSLLFFAFASLLIYLGLKVIEKAELFLTAGILTVVLLLALWSTNALNWSNLAEFDLYKLFIPYGVVLFAMGGLSAIPQQAQILAGHGKKLKLAIILGTLIPFLVYLVFAAIVIGVSGSSTTEVASIGLGLTLGPAMIIVANIFAFLTMSTSFLTLGLALKNTYNYDFNLNKKLSWLLTVSVPLLIFVAGFNDFEKVLGLGGAIGGGLQGILLGVIYMRLKKNREKQPEYEFAKSWWITGLLALMFIGGMVYTLWYL
ncbi:MAG: aromatic amino acid transport family protein [Candidatus Komeilibacteria bacterium]|nr:aromatic amino acid transport family protein [Candidatus Komeilibacteria bacterium]